MIVSLNILLRRLPGLFAVCASLFPAFIRVVVRKTSRPSERHETDSHQQGQAETRKPQSARPAL